MSAQTSRQRFVIYRGACQPHAFIQELTTTYTQAASHETKPCLQCHHRFLFFWNTGTLCRRRTFSVMSYRVYATGLPGLPCGNGISVLYRMESVNYCHTSPQPKTTQHLFVAGLQMVRTWPSGCGLFTMRPKDRLKVGAVTIQQSNHLSRRTTAPHTEL